VLIVRLQSPWKSIYLQLLGASTLYTLSSTVANLAIDSGGYVNGKLYGVGLIASVCWFVWIPLRARRVQAQGTGARSERGESSRGSMWAMLVVLIVSIPIIWELLQRNGGTGPSTLRLLIGIIALLCLASAAYLKEYLGRREMDFHFGLASDRLRLAMDAGASVGWDLDVRSGRNVWFGDLSIFGITSDTYVTTGADFHRFVHPDDRTRVSASIADARQNQKLYAEEFRVLQQDGTVRWLGARGKFFYARNGEPKRMLGVSVDITKRKFAEEALSGMNRKVIEAEERERARVARELHEDIGQRLALLAIAIQQITDDASCRTAGFLDPMEAVWTQTLEILSDVKASAHELYSPRLEYLGIAGVMKSFCEEFANRKNVDIDFSNGVVGAVRPDVSICLFRVLQEALHNGVMHSGKRQFRVELWAEADEIHLRVSDSGTGFDFSAERAGRGLGLVRIEQRVKLIEGITLIDSHPDKGTTVHVRVPAHAERDFMNAPV
jgi:PAS domain S-box-containing protein